MKHVRERVEKLEKQSLPEIPAEPEAPQEPEDNADDNDSDNDSAQLQVSHIERAGFLPNDHVGWRRNTILL